MEFELNFTRQDAILLNLQRACEACIDMANRMIKLRRLGYPKESKDSFEIRSRAMVLDRPNSMTMQAMVGFRNVAVYQYRSSTLPRSDTSSSIDWTICSLSVRRCCHADPKFVTGLKLVNPTVLC